MAGAANARWLYGWLLLGWLSACSSDGDTSDLGWPRHVTVLVSAGTASQARDALSALEPRLRALRGVEAVYGARGTERLFFALRWPLYLTAEELGAIESDLRDDRLGSSHGWLPAPVLPLVARHFRRANALYAASLSHAGSPDERELALLVRTRAGAEGEVSSAVRGLASGLGSDVRLALNDDGARALWLSAAAPLHVAVASLERAREIQREVAALAADPDFALQEARSIDTYLPGDAREQLLKSQQIRGFLTSDVVASWSQERRDRARMLLPVPLTRVPGPNDLPEHVREPFRDADGRVDRSLLLLPRPELDPRVAAHRARLRAALERAGITEPVQGAFMAESDALPDVSRWLALLAAALGLMAYARARGRRARRVLGALLSLIVVSTALTWAAAALAGSWLRAHVPALHFESLDGSLPGRIEARNVRIVIGEFELEAERVHLSPVGLATLGLRAEALVARGTVQLQGTPLRESLALGELSVETSPFAPAEPVAVTLHGGELELALQRAPGVAGLTGQLRLTPRLFGRLPLLREAEPVHGFSAATSAPQAVRVTPGWRIEGP